jgi:NTE family protein
MTEVAQKIRIILPGRAVYSCFQVGVLYELLKDDAYEVDFVYGVSAGSILAPYAANGQLQKALERLRISREEDVLESWRGWPRWLMRIWGFLFWRGALKRVKFDDILREDFAQTADPYAKCACVAWDIGKQEETWFTGDDYVEGAAASCTLPGIFPPRFFKGRYYYDGGLTEPNALKKEAATGFTGTYLFIGTLPRTVEPPAEENSSHELSGGSLTLLSEAFSAVHNHLAVVEWEHFKATVGASRCVEIYPTSNLLDIASHSLDLSPGVCEGLFEVGQRRVQDMRQRGELK